jgi:hypothetical protein
LNSLLHRREMTIQAGTSTVAGTPSYALPSDFGEAIAMHVVDGSVENVLEPADFDLIKAGYSNQSGRPVFWGFVQNEFLLGPTPDGTYSLKLYYYKTIPNLSGTQTTNWLLTTYPKIYLYGALAEAAATVSDDNRSSRWVSPYRSALKTLINDQIRDRGIGGGPMLRADLPFGIGARRAS